MQRIPSPAGATVSYDKYGSGPPLVLVHGAFSAVELAEIVIIIGGGDGSYNAGLAALQAKKKLIPIGCFGGAAAELLRELWKRGVPDLLPSYPSSTRKKIKAGKTR